MQSPSETMTCKEYGEDKPLSSFYRNKNYASGVFPKCKDCRREYHAMLKKMKADGTFIPQRGGYRADMQRVQYGTDSEALMSVEWLKTSVPIEFELAPRRIIDDTY